MTVAFLDSTCSLPSAYSRLVLIPVHFSPFVGFYSQFDLLSPRCRLHFFFAFWKENLEIIPQFILSASSHPLLAAWYGNVVANWRNLDDRRKQETARGAVVLLSVHDKQSLDRISTCFLIHFCTVASSSHNSPGWGVRTLSPDALDWLQYRSVDIGIDICQELRPKLLTYAWYSLPLCWKGHWVHRTQRLRFPLRQEPLQSTSFIWKSHSLLFWFILNIKAFPEMIKFHVKRLDSTDGLSAAVYNR